MGSRVLGRDLYGPEAAGSAFFLGIRGEMVLPSNVAIWGEYSGGEWVPEDDPQFVYEGDTSSIFASAGGNIYMATMGVGVFPLSGFPVLRIGVNAAYHWASVSWHRWELLGDPDSFTDQGWSNSGRDNVRSLSIGPSIAIASSFAQIEWTAKFYADVDVRRTNLRIGEPNGVWDIEKDYGLVNEVRILLGFPILYPD